MGCVLDPVDEWFAAHWRQYCHWQVDECLRSAILHEARHFFSLPQARTGAPSGPVAPAYWRLRGLRGWFTMQNIKESISIRNSASFRGYQRIGENITKVWTKLVAVVGLAGSNPICLRGTRMRMRLSTFSPSQSEHAGTVGVARRISAATNGSTQGIVEPFRSAVGIRLATPLRSTSCGFVAQ